MIVRGVGVRIAVDQRPEEFNHVEIFGAELDVANNLFIHTNLGSFMWNPMSEQWSHKTAGGYRYTEHMFTIPEVVVTMLDNIRKSIPAGILCFRIEV